MMICLITIFLFVCAEGQHIRPELLNHRNWAVLNRGDDCGESFSERIIGGKDASLGEYPWLARLGYGKRPKNNGSTSGYGDKNESLDYKCGGTIISERYILTAAHCLQGDGKKLISVRIGDYNVNTDPDCVYGICAPNVQDIEVEEYVPHPDFVPMCDTGTRCEKPDQQYHNDIALVRLSKPIEFNDYVYPACLPVYDVHYNTSYEGSTMIVAGWGVEGNWWMGIASSVLQKLSLPVVSLSYCNQLFREINFEGVMTEKQMCAGGERGQDSCAGDSGGPLVKAFSLGGPGRFFVMGIVSFGRRECASSTTPGVYTVVAEYLDWVFDTVRP